MKVIPQRIPQKLRCIEKSTSEFFFLWKNTLCVYVYVWCVRMPIRSQNLDPAAHLVVASFLRKGPYADNPPARQ